MCALCADKNQLAARKHNATPICPLCKAEIVYTPTPCLTLRAGAVEYLQEQAVAIGALSAIEETPSGNVGQT